METDSISHFKVNSLILTKNRMLRELPIEERPRERMIHCGPQALRLDELLAIVLRTGTHGRSVLAVASDLMARHTLPDLARTSPQELAMEHGIGIAKACELAAVFELARRLALTTPVERYRLSNAEEMADYFMPRLEHLVNEEFHVAYLNTKGKLLASRVISHGGLHGNIVEPRELFRWALIHRAACVVLAHNHPSGEPAPSPEDVRLTRELAEAGKFFDIPVADHLIVGDKKWISLKRMGEI